MLGQNEVPAAGVAARVREFARGVPEGDPFTVRELLGVGSRGAVDEALTRMVRSGQLERVARGVYTRPRFNAVLGIKVPPSPEAVVTAIARSSGETIAPHPAQCARQMGLSTQMLMGWTFLTNGSSRRVKIGQNHATLRHAAPRSLALAGRPAGAALAALRYLGAKEVTLETIRHVEQRIGPEETQVLRGNRAAMPEWLARLFRQTEEA